MACLCLIFKRYVFSGTTVDFVAFVDQVIVCCASGVASRIGPSRCASQAQGKTGHAQGRAPRTACGCLLQGCL